jgi:hypothetical protein
VGLLGREMQKSRAHQALIKKLLRAIRYLDSESREGAVRSLLDSLEVLYPVFPSLMGLFNSIADEVAPAVLEEVLGSVRRLFLEKRHVLQVPVNLAYALRVLGRDNSDEVDELLIKTHRNNRSMIVRRDIVLIMAKRQCDYWVADQKRQFHTATPWERRALLIGSYILHDEGSHWRRSVKEGLSPLEELVVQWASTRKQDGWSIPI